MSTNFYTKFPIDIHMKDGDAGIVIRENGELEMYIPVISEETASPASLVIGALFEALQYPNLINQLMQKVIDGANSINEDECTDEECKNCPHGCTEPSELQKVDPFDNEIKEEELANLEEPVFTDKEKKNFLN